MPALAKLWWAPAAARIPVVNVTSERLGGRHMPASLLTVPHGLAETKPPSFLLYANCEDEKSLLKVIGNKQQGLKSQIVVKGDRGYSVSGVKTVLCRMLPWGLAKSPSWRGLGNRLGHPHGLEKTAASREEVPGDLGLRYLLWACGCKEQRCFWQNRELRVTFGVGVTPGPGVGLSHVPES